MSFTEIVALVAILFLCGILFHLLCKLIYTIAFRELTIDTIKEVILTDKVLLNELRVLLNANSEE